MIKGRVILLALSGLLFGSLAAADDDAVGYVLMGSPVGPPQLGVVSLSFSGSAMVDCSPAVELGSLGRSAWGTALSPSGQLFALDIENDRLLLVDTASGAASPGVSLDIDVGAWGDLAFDDGGQLWLAAGTSLFTVDPATGSTVLVGEIGEEVEKLTAHNGSLFGASGARLMEIDTATGQGALVRDFNEPWGGAHFWALGSDGQNLWAIMHGWSEVSPSLYYEVAMLDPATGEFLDFRSFDLPEDEPFSLVVLRLQAPAVPGTTFLGSVLLVVLLAIAGLTFGFLLPQEGRNRLQPSLSRLVMTAGVVMPPSLDLGQGGAGSASS